MRIRNRENDCPSAMSTDLHEVAFPKEPGTVAFAVPEHFGSRLDTSCDRRRSRQWLWRLNARSSQRPTQHRPVGKSSGRG